VGLFDLFRRQKASSPDPGSADADLDEPRCDHYSFAHYALRIVAHENPWQCLAVLASPEAQTFLSDLLNSVAGHCKERGKDSNLRASDIIIHRVRAGGRPCAVLEMPLPRAIAEAFYMAVVLLVDPSSESPESEKGAIRYFTLEKGVVLDGPPRTVLCEWTAEGSHVNFGDGPAPRVHAFVQAIEGLLAK